MVHFNDKKLKDEVIMIKPTIFKESTEHIEESKEEDKMSEINMKSE